MAGSGRRVAVTGLGVISAAGLDVARFWESLRLGQSAIEPLQGIDGIGAAGSLRFSQGAQVRGFHPEDHLDERRAEGLDRFAQFAVVAAREALRDAALPLTPEIRRAAVVATGSAAGGSACEDRAYRGIYGEGRRTVPALSIPQVMVSAAASHICMDLGLQGPAFAFSTACSSASHALGHAFWMVRSGQTDLALAGGSEAPFSFVHLKAWEALRVIAPDTCRPFSRDRAGTILGEGGAMLVLEPVGAALARGARIHAELVGFGMSADAHHLTHPTPEGSALAIERALADAGMLAEKVGYVNAHGTGTLLNDAVEARALHLGLGSCAGRVGVSSTKSIHGHALGASGALEAVATVLALREGILPPTANFTELDPECDLDVVANTARPAAVDGALSLSLAFGGLNAVLAFRRWPGCTPGVAGEVVQSIQL
jgi:nodulation protein E